MLKAMSVLKMQQQVKQRQSLSFVGLISIERDADI